MAFNSLQFLIFFPLVLCVYFASPDRRRWAVVLAASLYFYAVWNPPFLLLFLGAIVISHACGIGIASAGSQKAKKTWLTAGLTILFSNLFLFKYFNFFNDNLREVFSSLNLTYRVPDLDWILPLGISFYTFQAASYMIDIYREKILAERHVGVYGAYLAYFPQLVAGPIERASNLLPQFYKKHRLDPVEIADGLKLMAWGLFKKVVVADRLGVFVQTVYGNPQENSGPALALGTFAFAFQVYCDFSGYSDIAIGAAQTMGFKLMKNFDRPYFATSIQDFWKRWHISLSTWLTDYVYTPLTRSPLIKLPWFQKFLLCLMLTFLVSGLWHGAKWTYVIWGALHGAYLCSSMISQKVRRKSVKFVGLDRVPALHRMLQIAFTFSLVNLSYIFFRAETVADAVYIVSHLATGWGLAALNPSGALGSIPHVGALTAGMLGMLIVLLVDLLGGFASVRDLMAMRPRWVRWSLYYAQVMIIILGASYDSDQQFIYFQF